MRVVCLGVYNYMFTLIDWEDDWHLYLQHKEKWSEKEMQDMVEKCIIELQREGELKGRFGMEPHMSDIFEDKLEEKLCERYYFETIDFEKEWECGEGILNTEPEDDSDDLELNKIRKKLAESKVTA